MSNKQEFETNYHQMMNEPSYLYKGKVQPRENNLFKLLLFPIVYITISLSLLSFTILQNTTGVFLCLFGCLIVITAWLLAPDWQMTFRHLWKLRLRLTFLCVSLHLSAISFFSTLHINIALASIYLILFAILNVIFNLSLELMARASRK